MTQKYEAKKGLGKKTVFSNAYREVPRTRGDGYQYVVPAYDDYKASFGLCDKLNLQLTNSTWPHRRGGRNQEGDRGHQHDFALAVTLLNTFNAYRTIRLIDKDDYSFERYCTDLAIELFKKYATA